MRQICVLVFLAFLCGCAGIPRISTPAPVVPHSKGIKSLGFINTDQLEPVGLRSPSAVAVDFSGNLYICDTNNDRIVKLNPQGELLRQQGGFGGQEGQFNRPTGLTIDRGLNLYVADSQNKRVQYLDINLNFVSVIQPAETLDFRGLGNPYDVASSGAGELYISDTWNDWVVQTDNFFAFKSKIGGFDAGEGKLQDPLGLACDSRGNLYVADSGNRRIALFDNFGNYLKSIGSDILAKPSDVALAGDEILVSDQNLAQILDFDQQGRLLWQQGSRGTQAGQLQEPAGLTIFQDRLYVAEKGNDRVQIFQIIR